MPYPPLSCQACLHLEAHIISNESHNFKKSLLILSQSILPLFFSYNIGLVHEDRQADDWSDGDHHSEANYGPLRRKYGDGVTKDKIYFD